VLKYGNGKMKHQQHSQKGTVCAQASLSLSDRTGEQSGIFQLDKRAGQAGFGLDK
jgi:hypothetical protein